MAICHNVILTYHILHYSNFHSDNVNFTVFNEKNNMPKALEK